MSEFIPTFIEDALGLKTGISIDNVRVLVDRDNDCITITGRMAAGAKYYTSFEFEPEIEADLLNSENQVCLSATSNHEGCVAASQKISFLLRFSSISKYVSWSEIRKIEVYVIFKHLSSI